MTTSGVVGNSVIILGTGLTGASNVSFGNTAAAFKVVSDSEITATVPIGAITGSVTAMTGTETFTSNSTYHVKPTITGFAPPSGPVGTVVTINGMSLTQTSKVRFNGKAAAFSVNSDTQITATVPVGAVTGKINVTAAGGSVTSASSFTVTP